MGWSRSRKQAITALRARVGFDPPAAVDVFESVSVIALGTAMQENRVRAPCPNGARSDPRVSQAMPGCKPRGTCGFSRASGTMLRRIPMVVLRVVLRTYLLGSHTAAACRSTMSCWIFHVGILEDDMSEIESSDAPGDRSSHRTSKRRPAARARRPECESVAEWSEID